MILHEFSYITLPDPSGDIESDVRTLLEENSRRKTADKFGLESSKCIAAGLLHDISAIIKPADMLEYAQHNNFELCEAEQRFPFLLHQRMSRIISSDYFGIIDADVLSAIECHTTLKAQPSDYDMALFIADKLAWDQEGIPPFYDSVMRALDSSLEMACLAYMNYMDTNGKLLCPHTNWDLAYDWLQTRA